MKLRIDRAADALYLRFDDSKIIESERVAPRVIVDFDSKNNVVGVEVLHLSERAPQLSAKSLPRNTAPETVRVYSHAKMASASARSSSIASAAWMAASSARNFFA